MDADGRQDPRRYTELHLSAYPRRASRAATYTREAHDTKLTQLFGAGSIVIGLASLIGDGGGSPTDGLLLAAVVVYALLAVLTLWAVRVRRFRRSLQADQLWQEHWADDLIKLKHAIVHDISEAYAHNKAILEKKAQAVKWATGLMGLEVLLVAAAILWSRWA